MCGHATNILFQAALDMGINANETHCCDIVYNGICMHGSTISILVEIRPHSTMLSCTGATPDNKAYQVHLEVLTALNAALAAVPTAFRSHQKALETFVCQLLARPDLSIDHRREAAHCYAALTKVKGECKVTPCNLRVLYAIAKCAGMPCMTCDRSKVVPAATVCSVAICQTKLSTPDQLPRIVTLQ